MLLLIMESAKDICVLTRIQKTNAMNVILPIMIGPEIAALFIIIELLFRNRFVQYLTGPQPYSKTVPNHTVKICFLLCFSQLLASCNPILMSIFSSPVSTGWSYQPLHGQLSLSSTTVDSVYLYSCDVAKMGIQHGNAIISANTYFQRLPLAAKVCSNLVATQSCLWNNQIPSLTAGARAGSIPMVPLFRYFDQARMPQSCMRALLRAQWIAQWNPLQWKHTRVKAFAFTRTSSPLRGELLFCLLYTSDAADE